MHFRRFLLYIYICSDTSTVAPLRYGHHVHAHMTRWLKCQLRKLFSLACPLHFLMSAFLLILACSFVLTFPSPCSPVLTFPLLCLSVPFLGYRGSFSRGHCGSHRASSDQDCMSRLCDAGGRWQDGVISGGKGGSVRSVTSVSGDADKADITVLRAEVSRETVCFSPGLSEGKVLLPPGGS